MLGSHRRQGAKDDEVEGSLEDFDALGFFTGHLSGVNSVSTGMSSKGLFTLAYGHRCSDAKW